MISPDLDDLIRTSLRANADNAPHEIDLVGVRRRAVEITRRRRLEAVAAAAAVVVLVGGAAVAMSTLRGATPDTPPITSDSPRPSGSASVSSAPTEPPTPATLPWVATVGSPSTGSPSSQQLSVNVNSTLMRVDDAENAVIAVLGWFGEGHRTLVWESGQDTMALQSATFGPDGSLTVPPGPLSIPGLTAADRGYGFPVAGGGFAFVREDGTSALDAVYVDDSLTVTSRRPIPSAGTPIFATREVVGVQEDATTIALFGTGTQRWTLPAQCRAGTTVTGTPATPEAGGAWVAYRCPGGVVAQIPLTVTGSGGRISTLPPVPGGGEVIATWFDADVNLYASSQDNPRTSTSASVRTSRQDGESLSPWVPARTQNVIQRVDTGAGFSIALYADAPVRGGAPNSWWTETTPAVLIGTGAGTLSAVGPTIAVRPEP